MTVWAVTLAAVALLLALAGCSDQRPSAQDTERAFIAAAGQGDTAAVRGFLDRGVAVDVADGRGRTPLIAASYGAHLDTARVLMEAGADVNLQDDTLQSAHLIATSEIGPDDGLELLQLTLDHGADVGTHDSFDGTGLIRAAHRGYVDIIELLLTTDIAIDHVNNLRWTALLEAIILGDGGRDHTEVVALLLEAGADPGLADGDGVTPLAHARDRGFDQIAALLEGAGATA